jgi:cytoskeleton protein RodZ
MRVSCCCTLVGGSCVASFGERLQREREMRGITLEEIAEATKIGTRALRALEAQDFEKLPGGIFNKGFVRSYARYLGLDEEQAVADYEAALRDKHAAQAGKPLLEQEEKKEQPSPLAGSRRLGALILLLASLVCLLAYFAWTRYSRASRRASQPLTPASAASPGSLTSAGTDVLPSSGLHAAPPEVPVGTPPADSPAPGSTPQSPASGRQAEAGEFEVRLQALEDCWVSVTADGGQLIAATLPASTERTIRARNQLVLKLGNAAAVNVFFNGTPVPPLGLANQTSTLTFTPAGLRP